MFLFGGRLRTTAPRDRPGPTNKPNAGKAFCVSARRGIGRRRRCGFQSRPHPRHRWPGPGTIPGTAVAVRGRRLRSEERR